MTDADLLQRLNAMGERFSGVDITFRRFAPTEWKRAAIGKPYAAAYGILGKLEGIDARWRVRIVTSKNERAEYRTVGYGETFADAAKKVLGL